ncbi:UNVERIFIED_CONTAM: hypothetical protein Sradi_4357900 [Sesamum radiatum]|uniref:Uncharacterized protein n=1 Tax=Sesamum radiatum TaxID=300843 RepID=A0AAW2NRX3_SESRA
MVYSETGSLVDGRLLNTGCFEDSSKIMYGLMQVFIIQPKKTREETKWKDFLALTAGSGEQGTDEVEDDIAPDTDESPTASSSGSPPSISKI